jgi:two-component system response regulator AtoC
MTESITVLVVEDDEDMRVLLEEELRDAGYDVAAAAGGADALDRMAETPVDIVVTDLVMSGMKGNELLSEILARDPDIPVIIITAFGSVESAVKNIKAGAFHYLTKPFRTEDLKLIIDEALRKRAFKREVVSLQNSFEQGNVRIVARSPSMLKVLDVVQRASPTDVPVLLLGESGTGKELLARILHEESPRKKGSFVAVNCSAIPEQLLESILFGHRRGAFTDAKDDQAGLFQVAHDGTVFLDEIGDMPIGTQGKILRVLQEGTIHPLGAPAPVLVDTRVIAATNRDVESLLQKERFRRDLFYRLNVVTVEIPPLRERPEDLLPLAAYFLNKHGQRLKRPGCSLSTDAMEALRRYQWPGNVRELENVIARAIVLGKDRVIDVRDLPATFQSHLPRSKGPSENIPPIAEVEREHIVKTLRYARGNKAQAARLLGMDRKTLYRKMKAYKIDSP